MNNSDSRMMRLQAAYLTGCFGRNVFQAYLPFLLRAVVAAGHANIDIATARMDIIQRYGLDLPPTFVHSILKVGHQCGDLGYDSSRGTFMVLQKKDEAFNAEDESFCKKWENLKSAFEEFASARSSHIDISDDEILRCIDECHAIEIGEEDDINQQSHDTIEFLWRLFVLDQNKRNTEMFSFIAALSISAVVRDSKFYEGDARNKFSGLKVYLDTPIVFGLLGLEEAPRIELCKHFVKQLRSANCELFIFDQCLQELERNILDAADWIHSPDYDASKASPVARALFDARATVESITSRIEGIEEELLELGVSVAKTQYSSSEDKFQEDERKLESLLISRYNTLGRAMSAQRKQGILVDIRSIVFVCRFRRGYTPTHLYDARHILVTLNSAVAGAAHDYIRGIYAKDNLIPPCVTADVLGSVLWLFSPVDLTNYRKLRLLADCYAQTNPNRELLSKFTEHLHNLHEKGQISEAQFMRCRASSLVRRPLAAHVFGNAEACSEKTCYEIIEELEESERFARDAAVAKERDRWSARLEDVAARKDAEIANMKKEQEEVIKAKEAELMRSRMTALEERTKAQELDRLVSSTAMQYDLFLKIVLAPAIWAVLGALLFSMSSLLLSQVKGIEQWLMQHGVRPFWINGAIALISELAIGWKTPLIKFLSEKLRGWVKGRIAKSA